MPCALGRSQTVRPVWVWLGRLGKPDLADQLVSKKAIRAPAVNVVASWRSWAPDIRVQDRAPGDNCRGLARPIASSKVFGVCRMLSALRLREGASAVRDMTLRSGRVVSELPLSISAVPSSASSQHLS